MYCSKSKTAHWECILTNQDGRNDGKRGKAGKGQTGQQTLVQVGLLGPNTLQTEDSPNIFGTKELEEAGKKKDYSVGSVDAKISKIPLSDGSMTESMNVSYSP